MPDPWRKAVLALDAPQAPPLRLAVPHDVFSTLRIDEGTLLLLGALPATPPTRVLEIGCGYGALGLPVAARFPQAEVHLVDRDLLAVEWSRRNADSHSLSNVKAYGSLGFREVPGESRFDWILCNVPARIGRPFIEHLLGAGRCRLTPLGEIRVVVIRDLAPTIEAIRSERGWPIAEILRGPRHIVYSLTAPSSVSPTPDSDESDLYLRDQIEVSGCRIGRPFDLGGDDPLRLRSAIPLLFDALPKTLPGDAPVVLHWRIGYGAIALPALKRWPEAKLVAIERDLLAADFTLRNARTHGFAQRIEVRSQAHFPDGIRESEKFALAFGELSPSAGLDVAAAEILSVKRALRAGGEAYFLCLEKLEREWIQKIAATHSISIYRVMSREGFAACRMT